MAHPRMKISIVALCLAAVALASAGVVARQAGGETAPSAGLGGPAPAGRNGTGVPLLPPAAAGRDGHDDTGRGGVPLPPADDDTGRGGALPSPAPAAAPLPAAGHGAPDLPAPPAGRDATPARAGGGHGHDGTGALAPVEAPLPVADVDPHKDREQQPRTSPLVVEETFAPQGAVNVVYNIARGSYVGFQNQLHQVLATSKLAEGVPVMAPQTFSRPPPTWIMIQLLGGSPKEKITLALRNDNAYIAGFSTASGSWFAFPRYQRQIAGSTALPKEESYGSLIGGSMNLVNLDISKDAALEAVRFMSAYKISDDETKLGSNCATIIVIVAEAARFTRIYNTVISGLQQQQRRLAATDAKSVVLWGDLSRDIIDFNKTRKWTADKGRLGTYKEAGIDGAQAAIAAVRLLVRPSDFKLCAAQGNDTCN